MTLGLLYWWLWLNNSFVMMINIARNMFFFNDGGYEILMIWYNIFILRIVAMA